MPSIAMWICHIVRKYIEYISCFNLIRQMLCANWNHLFPLGWFFTILFGFSLKFSIFSAIHIATKNNNNISCIYIIHTYNVGLFILPVMAFLLHFNFGAHLQVVVWTNIHKKKPTVHTVECCLCWWHCARQKLANKHFILFALTKQTQFNILSKYISMTWIIYLFRCIIAFF